MTTPETARTAARNDFITTTAARHFPDAIRLCAEGHARGEHAMPPRDEIAVDCIHGAIALANKLEEMNAAPWLPEPQASKASEGEGRQTDFTESEMRAAPAGEAVSVARDVAEQWLARVKLYDRTELFPATVELMDAIDRALPTPPPAPASKCHPCGVTTAIPVTVTETARLHEPAASLSVAPAREGFTYPDAEVEKAINRIVAWTKHASLENNLNLHDTPSMLTAARVTPPQQEEDRSWEKECEIRANGVVSYPSTASTTGFVYLVPDGRWLTYVQWLILDPSLDRFPSEAAALSALAQASRPTT